MKVAALQMVSTPRVRENLQQALELIAQAAKQGAELVALPEYFCLMGQHDHDKLTIAEPPGQSTDSPLQQALRQAAQQHGIWIVGGTIPLSVPHDHQHVFNATLVYSPNGTQVARYDKIHLFRYADGQQSYNEATTLLPGQKPQTFSLETSKKETWRIGLSICYDLRFPELYRSMMQTEAGGPCDIFILPAAFTYTTGQAHWEPLLRARAIENQCYIIAPAQGGQHENKRRTWGHSMIINPWGEILAMQATGAGVVMVDLSYPQLQTIRSQLPALEHRKPLPY